MTTEPSSLRDPRELAMDLLAASEAYWHGGISGNGLIIARLTLFAALDAQEATLRRCRDLAEEWESEAAEIFARNTQPFSNGYTKAIDRCSVRLTQALAGKDGPQ